MRLRRLTETKSTGKTWVDEKTQADYKAGGERREWLEIALLEALKKHGTGRDAYKRVKAEFLTRVVVVRERMQSKELETTGKWLTEEKMKAEYDKKWKYNEDVEDFFVEDETTVKLKRADLTRQVDTTEMDDRVLVIELFF
ncbi:unnamed protein product [Cladocopium goreaui]|uniref:Uncharacterized protein n=2 Tax=Cladocopium goreaui TaxID=2562237 RepID=A0A9P1BYH9_9DINO|nr:unnamed protein product [Cladocopium goreaui]